MAHEIRHDLRLERMMNLIADSEYELSDEELLLEITEVGDNPMEEAQSALKTARDVSQQLEVMNNQLLELGHRICSKNWRPGGADYTNRCLDCGLVVSLSGSTGMAVGRVLYTPCFSANQYAVARQGGAS